AQGAGVRGKDGVKLGGEFINNPADVFVTANGKGSIRFANSGKGAAKRTGLENFLLGKPRNSGTLSAILVGDPERHLSNQSYAAFMQDDWHVKPRLTQNRGWRYKPNTVIRDR